MTRVQIRASSGHSILTLQVRHTVVIGETALETVPRGVGVFLPSGSLALSISGTWNRTPVDADVLHRSQAVRFLVQYLRRNAEQLGITGVSEPLKAGNTQSSNVHITSGRQIGGRELPPLFPTLAGVELCYSWVSEKSDNEQPGDYPFSERIALPCLTLLNNVVIRFAQYQLLRRYPLIFGTWCKQLDVEATITPLILKSIHNIHQRSSSRTFKEACKKLLNDIVLQAQQCQATHAKSLGQWAGGADLPRWPSDPENSVLVLMERIYTHGLKQPVFKSTGAWKSVENEDSDMLDLVEGSDGLTWNAIDSGLDHGVFSSTRKFQVSSAVDVVDFEEELWPPEDRTNSMPSQGFSCLLDPGFARGQQTE